VKISDIQTQTILPSLRLLSNKSNLINGGLMEGPPLSFYLRCSSAYLMIALGKEAPWLTYRIPFSALTPPFIPSRTMILIK